MTKIIGLFYFSGTGNTEVVTDLFAQEFGNRGAGVVRIKIEDVLQGNVLLGMDRFSFIGIGFPVYGFDAPKIIYDFLKIIPFSLHKKAFIFKTSADPCLNGGPTEFVRNKLIAKGYDVTYESALCMPSNVFIKYPDELSKELYHSAQQRVAKAVEEIWAGKQKLPTSSFVVRLFVGVAAFFLQRVAGPLFGKTLRVSPVCILCGHCLKVCPVGNISRKNNKNVFDWYCCICMRCIYECPQKAIMPMFRKNIVLKTGYDIRSIIHNPNLKGEYAWTEQDRRSLYKGLFGYLHPKEVPQQKQKQ